MSEEQQLEAAIKASLLHTEKEHSSLKHHPTESEDFDFVSLSSGEEDMVSDFEMEQDKDTDIHPWTTAQDTLNVRESQLPREQHVAMFSTNSNFINKTSHELPSRKRKSDELASEANLPVRKMLHNSTAEPQLVNKSAALARHRGGQKGAVSVSRKGKQRARSVSSALTSVEERLAAGDLQQKDVSQLIFRLPDGTRLKKTFLSNSALQVSSNNYYNTTTRPKIIINCCLNWNLLKHNKFHEK